MIDETKKDKETKDAQDSSLQIWVEPTSFLYRQLDEICVCQTQWY